MVRILFVYFGYSTSRQRVVSRIRIEYSRFYVDDHVAYCECTNLLTHLKLPRKLWGSLTLKLHD
jgi:hypothetical protein